MHVPDGFIDLKTAVAASTLAVAGVGIALRQVKKNLPARRIPLLGLGAAFTFAAQMVNFPVIGGTSGHLVGGTLIATLLGLPAAVIVMTTVLIAQCFLFADGGVTALGVNIFNMAIVAPLVGFGVFRVIHRLLPSLRGKLTAVAFAGWCSTVIASIACAGQLAWSGTVSWSAALPAMAGIHMLIGLGEGVISALVFFAVVKARPEIIDAAPAESTTGFVGYSLLATLGVAAFVAPFACPWPDGLDAVADKLGFAHAAQSSVAAPLTDYAIPGIHSPALATAIAGVVGAIVVFGLALLLSRLLVKNQPPEANNNLTHA
ncbi:MAG: energy-coupling factor ABC transporter permease [Nibricoccus sp.]